MTMTTHKGFKQNAVEASESVHMFSTAYGVFLDKSRPGEDRGLGVGLVIFAGKLLLMAEIMHHLGCVKPYK